MSKILRLWGALLVLLFAASLTGSGQQPSVTPPPVAPTPEPVPDVNQLVKTAVAKEMKAAGDDSHLYRYVLSRETSSGVLVRDMVETKGIIVARTLSWNGRPLTAEERHKDDERLKKLLSSEEEQQNKLREQKEEQERVNRLLGALPRALQYRFDGREVIQGRDTIRLSFRPKPGFSAYKETYLYKASEGFLWIDAQDLRLRRLVATLQNDVNIGWGILGHIDKGSHLEVEQELVPGQEWRITRLIMEGTGRAFIFKSVKIHTVQHAYNFRSVQPMTLAAAIQLLQMQPLTVAEEH